MTKDECRKVYDAMTFALNEVARQFNLDLEVRPGSYGATFYRPKVEFQSRAVNGVPKEEAQFKALASAFGLVPEDYRRVVSINREDYKVVGFAVRRPKYPLLVERVSDGKRVFATQDVIDRMKRVPKLADNGRTDPPRLVEVPFGQ